MIAAGTPEEPEHMPGDGDDGMIVLAPSPGNGSRETAKHNAAVERKATVQKW